MARCTIFSIGCCALCAVAGLLVGCPEQPNQDDAGPDASGGDAGVLDLTRDPSCPDDVAWLAEVQGAVVDERGEPVGDAMAQMCVRTHGGRFLCLQPQATAADGAFHIVVQESARCADRATLRVLVPQAARATLYCGVELSATTPSLRIDDPFVMIATEAPAARPDPGDDTVERTVVFADGLELDVTPAALVFPEDYARLAARALAPSAVPGCLLQGAPSFASLYAFSPEAELSDAAFAMRIPNTTGLAEGTGVELWLLGGLSTSLADQTRVEEGVWARFGVGTVIGTDSGTVSGTVIDVVAAQGIPSLNWMGLRAAP